MPINEKPGRNGQILINVQSPKTEQEEAGNMNRQVTSNETESVIQKLSTSKSPDPGTPQWSRG